MGDFVLLVTWIIGILIAKGFWSTFFACIIPPYAWYLAIEKLMIIQGLI